MPLIRLNPITRKRLQRFRRMRRAYWSFWLLILLYLTSMAAPIIANDRPLHIYFEGRHYWLPFAIFYPAGEFEGSDRKTRPDYLDLADSPLFAAETGNFMIFPPVRCSPDTTIEKEDVQIPEEVTLTIARKPRVGAIRVNPEWQIIRHHNSGFFFGMEEEEVIGISLPDHYALNEGLRAAVEARFRNESAPEVSKFLRSRADRITQFQLRAYEPRRMAPTLVRITVREPEPERANNQTIVFDPEGRVLRGSSRIWDGLAEDERKRLTAKAVERFEGLVASEEIEVSGASWELSFDKPDFTYPFRPIPGHLMGLDSSGRDVFSRILYATFIAMSFALIMVFASKALGIVAGALQGYYAGWVDISAQRFIEIWSSLPFLYIIILLGSVLGRSFGLLLLVYGIFNWIGISYYMRAEFLKLRRAPFVEAARCLGIPTWKILFKHILPNSLVPVITFFPFSLVGAIASLTALDYLGYGLPVGTPSWGQLLEQAREFRWAWWLIVYPSLATFVVMLLGVFVGEGVRSAFDPKVFARME